MTTEELRIILSASGASQTGQAIRNVTTRTNEFNASLGSLYGTIAKFLSIGMIGKFAKDCVNAASDLQEVANVMDVTFGDKASQIDQWAKTQASSFGLSETAAKRYAGNIGTMAKQFGFTTEQAAAMSTQLTKLTGDVASFYNLDNATAYNKLKSIFTGETESLKELGVVMTETQLNAYAMEKGFGKQVKEMTEGEKVMLRYSFVTEKLSHANDDFSRTSDGWANSVRTFDLELENLKIQIGNELIPVASYGLQLISDGLRVISPVIVGIAETVKNYVEAWKNADDVTKAYFKTALGIVAVMIIAPKLISFISTAVRLLTVQISTLGGVLTLIGGIAAALLVAEGFKRLSQQIEDSGNVVDDFADAAENTSDYVDTLADSVDGLSDSAKDLDLFLASFDEVNKVGSSGSLMSSIVNADDISNILDASSGLDDIFGKMEDLKSTASGFNLFGGFDLKGFFNEFTNGDWKEDWLVGAEMIANWMEENFPKLTAKLQSIGDQTIDILETSIDGWTKAFNAIFGKEETQDPYSLNDPNELLKNAIVEALNGKGTTANMVRQAQLYKYGMREYGTNTALINWEADNTKKTYGSELRAGFERNRTEAPINVRTTVELDGETIGKAVYSVLNKMTKSSGNSPLIEMG